MFFYDDRQTNKGQLITTMFHFLACTQNTDYAFSLLSNRYHFNLSFHGWHLWLVFFCIHVYDNRQISLFLSSNERIQYIKKEKERQRLNEGNNRWARRHCILSSLFFYTNCCPFLFISGHGCLTLVVYKREKSALAAAVSSNFNLSSIVYHKHRRHTHIYVYTYIYMYV
jgi:hypothetical protein